MELVKTFDSVGNVSEETYIEDSQGFLVETSLEVGEQLPYEPTGLPRIYFKTKRG